MFSCENELNRTARRTFVKYAVFRELLLKYKPRRGESRDGASLAAPRTRPAWHNERSGLFVRTRNAYLLSAACAREAALAGLAPLVAHLFVVLGFCWLKLAAVWLAGSWCW